MTIRDDTAKQYKHIRKILRDAPIIDEPIPDHYKYIRWAVYVGCVLVIIVLLVGCDSPAMAYTQNQAVKAVIGEAEGEGLIGMEAVACAISNRHSLHGVYGLHSQRVIKHLYTAITYNNALKAVLRAKSPDFCENLVHGATGWGNLQDIAIFKHETWFPSVVFTAHIGHHYFYSTDN